MPRIGPMSAVQRTPHLTACCIAAGLASVLLSAATGYARRLELRWVHVIAPRVNLLLTHSPALQRAALAQADLLPIYGSSELAMPVENRAALFFREYPTGFEVFPIGMAGSYPLITLQKLAAAAPELRGRKVVISLSSGWFRHDEMRLDAFLGNFSPLDSYEFLFSARLSMKLKGDVARRLEPLGTPIARLPVGAFALHQLAESSRTATMLYWTAWPLGKLQTAILRLQDHYEAYCFLSTQEGRPKKIHRTPVALDWPSLIATASALAGDTPGDESDPAAFGSSAQFRDPPFRQHLSDSHLWPDLTMLLRTLRELGAEPLILTTPFFGPHQSALHISRAVRQEYYDRFTQQIRGFGFAHRTFEQHDEDKRFVTDEYDHLSEKGWMIYNQALDEFFRNAMPPAPLPPTTGTAPIPPDHSFLRVDTEPTRPLSF